MTTPLVELDVRFDPVSARAALVRDAKAGLSAAEKSLPPVWFYDETGSNLFDQITRLPEYYPTREERALLEAHASDVARSTNAATLVELGAGTCTKTRVLLDAMRRHGTLRRYVAVDVAESTLLEATSQIASEYDGLQVTATVADFEGLEGLIPQDATTLVAFLGGTIGNLEPTQRSKFLASLDAQLGHGDHLLVGTDLVKNRARLVAAYDDSSGVTASFNRNVLRVLNRELGADFDPDSFEHVARFDEDRQWIEMRLRSLKDQRVSIPGLGLEVDFSMGEEMRTEVSAKFTPEGVATELGATGFVVDRQFGAERGEFLLTLAHPYC